MKYKIRYIKCIICPFLLIKYLARYRVENYHRDLFYEYVSINHFLSYFLKEFALRNRKVVRIITLNDFDVAQKLFFFRRKYLFCFGEGGIDFSYTWLVLQQSLKINHKP